MTDTPKDFYAPKELHARTAFIDANGSCLTGWVLLFAWVHAMNAARDSGRELGDAAAMLSPAQYDWILSHAAVSAISSEILGDRIHVWGVPIMKHKYIQDELVTIHNSDGEIFAQIKNIARPQTWEPTDSQQQSAETSG
jgi:hypothetical protein